MNTSASYSHEVAKSFLSSDQTETFQGKYWILFKRDQKLKFSYLLPKQSSTNTRGGSRGRVQGVHTPRPEMKPSLYLVFKCVYLTDDR